MERYFGLCLLQYFSMAQFEAYDKAGFQKNQNLGHQVIRGTASNVLVYNQT